MENQFHPITNKVDRLIWDTINGIDHDTITYYLQQILGIIDLQETNLQSRIKNNGANDPLYHYILSILNNNKIYQQTMEKITYNLIYGSEMYFENYKFLFAKVMNGSTEGGTEELLYQSIGYYIVGYIVMIYYIPVSLSLTDQSDLKDKDLELYGLLISFYKNEYYFNQIRGEIEEYISNKNSKNLSDNYYFPTIKKRKSTKSYLTDYGPDNYNNENNNDELDNYVEQEDVDDLVNSYNDVELTNKELPSITAKSVQKYLLTLKKNVLLVDLRSMESFNTNQIINKFIVNLNPSLLYSNREHLDDDGLEKLLKKILKKRFPESQLLNMDFDENDQELVTIKNSYNYFKQRHKFHLIVYYTDHETWETYSKLNFNYLQFFYNLIFTDKATNASRAKKLLRPPKLLVEGVESWLHFLEAQQDDDASIVNQEGENYYVPQPREIFKNLEPASLDPYQQKPSPQSFLPPLNSPSTVPKKTRHKAASQEPPPLPKKNSSYFNVSIHPPVESPPPVPNKLPTIYGTMKTAGSNYPGKNPKNITVNVPSKKFTPHAKSKNQLVALRNPSGSRDASPVSHVHRNLQENYIQQKVLPQPNSNPPPVPPPIPSPKDGPKESDSKTTMSPYEASREQKQKRTKPSKTQFAPSLAPPPIPGGILNQYLVNPPRVKQKSQAAPLPVPTVSAPISTIPPPIPNIPLYQTPGLLYPTAQLHPPQQPGQPITQLAPHQNGSSAPAHRHQRQGSRGRNLLQTLSIVGLKNYGSNCYINGLLQCVFGISSFPEVFLNSYYKNYATNPNNKAAISSAMGKLFDKMSTYGGVIIAPTNFLNNCSRRRPDFKIPYQQQDTAEFLIFLLDVLHEELRGSDLIINQYPELVVPALNLHDITNFDANSRLSINVTDEEIRNYNKWFRGLVKSSGVSPITAFFQGQLESCLKCVKCLKVSKTFATFSVLTLPIVEKSATKRKIRLEDCIKLFTTDEILSGDNAWDCPNCKKKGEQLLEANSFYNHNYGENDEPVPGPEQAPPQHNKTFFNLRKKKDQEVVEQPPPPLLKEKYQSLQITGNKTIKSLKFIDLPRVLVINLSRFKFNKYGEQSSKNTQTIVFPITLDIKVKDKMLTYKLLALINHFGNLKSGHYTSIVNKQKNTEHYKSNKNYWCYFDDENFKVNINPGINYGDNTIASSDVYVLFYQRVESVI